MRAAAVLHVPRSIHSSVVIGYERLGRLMQARGHALEIYTPQELLPRSVPGRFLPLVLPFAVRRAFGPRRDLDVIIFHSYTGWAAGRAGGARKVVSFHGFEPLFHEAHDAEARRAGAPLSLRYRTMYGTVMPKMLRVACRNADLVTCLNADERDAIISRGFAPASKVRLLWHDAPAGFFVPHDYRPRARTILVVMQWLRTKGTAYLVDAFTELARRHPDLQLVAAGTLLDEQVVCAAFPADVRPRVRVVPRFGQQEHLGLLRDADIFVHPSLSEAYGRAVIEAMAAGVPTVTTRTGIAIGNLKHDEHALVVPPADARALSAAIEQLIHDPARRQALGEAGQRYAEGLRSLDSSETLIAMLEALAAGRPLPA